MDPLLIFPQTMQTATLTANGSLDIPLERGAEYIFALKGPFGGATVTMTTQSPVTPSQQDSVDNGSFTAETEQLFLAPSNEVRLTVSGASGSPAIRASFVKRKYQSE